MKKLFTTITVFILVFALFTIPVFAEDEIETPTENQKNEVVTESAPEEIAPIPSENGENLPTTRESEVLEQILGFITNGEIWAKIGVTVISVLALILAIKASLGKICDGIIVLKDFIAGKATREETENAISSAVDAVKKEYENKHKELVEQNEQLSGKYDKMTAILTLTVLQLVKSPNARVEIMGLISETKEISGDIAKVVEKISEKIADADASTPKEDTPALDSIIKDHTNEEDNVIRLG